MVFNVSLHIVTAVASVVLALLPWSPYRRVKWRYQIVLADTPAEAERWFWW